MAFATLQSERENVEKPAAPIPLSYPALRIRNLSRAFQSSHFSPQPTATRLPILCFVYRVLVARRCEVGHFQGGVRGERGLIVSTSFRGIWSGRSWTERFWAMAMMGVVRRSGFMKNVARVVCSAVVEAPRMATGERVLQGAVQGREASNLTFEPGFHWRKMIQAHHMSCCANLGNPPPREITVEYCEDSEYTDYFIEIADKVEAAHPEMAVLVSPNNTEARKGSFEITCDGHVIWSKLKKGRLPRFEDVLDGISELPSKCDIEPQSASA